jgi:hypothetical protein
VKLCWVKSKKVTHNPEGARPKYAQNMGKICATLKMGSYQVLHILSSLHFCFKTWWYFWSGRSADHFQYPQDAFLIFFFEKIWSFGVPNFWRSKNIHPKPIFFDGSSPEKLQNMRKICGNMRSTYPPCITTRNVWGGAPSALPSNTRRRSAGRRSSHCNSHSGTTCRRRTNLRKAVQKSLPIRQWFRPFWTHSQEPSGPLVRPLAAIAGCWRKCRIHFYTAMAKNICGSNWRPLTAIGALGSWSHQTKAFSAEQGVIVEAIGWQPKKREKGICLCK